MEKLVQLNLPEYDFNIRRAVGGLSIFDDVRRRFVALTPEEWVRQNFVRFLIESRHFPLGLIGNEVSLLQNGIKRRCDTLIVGRDGTPFVIVEYKAPHIEITQSVFDQIFRYNLVLKAQYLIVSNGLAHYCCKIDYGRNSYSFLKDIPYYDDIAGQVAINELI